MTIRLTSSKQTLLKFDKIYQGHALVTLFTLSVYLTILNTRKIEIETTLMQDHTLQKNDSSKQGRVNNSFK